ncbi:MAG: nucleotidyltransferase domain-containing protein [Rhodocyclaceae bacterium]|nr:nucleotidyltransferase domain-containing protein [Rhodocyclaceae bacterium]
MTTNHPVSPEIRAQITANLKAIESRHEVTILFACESGSRGWGFSSPDSDYDVRFIYVHRLPWYLQVSTPRAVIEEPITGDLDINGWELRKALGLLKKGNATLIEWLDSPIIYQADEAFLSRLREAARQTHRAERSFHHYAHMARKNYREYLQGDSVRLKKYLYVLRPLLATLWIEQGRGIAPMPFQSLVDTLISDAELLAAIEQLLINKRAAKESEYGCPMPVINQFIATELTRLESILPPVIRDTDFSVLDQLLMDVVMQQTSVS